VAVEVLPGLVIAPPADDEVRQRLRRRPGELVTGLVQGAEPLVDQRVVRSPAPELPQPLDDAGVQARTLTADLVPVAGILRGLPGASTWSRW